MARACSFLPAATEIVKALGLEASLVGATFECDAPPAVPRIVRSALEGRTLTSGEIDEAVRSAAAAGETLYRIDEPLLREAAPDVIFTQHLCGVCQIGTATAEAAVADWASPPRIVPLVPHTLEEVLACIGTVARELGAPEAGERLLASLRARLAAAAAATEGVPRVEALFLEWIDPLFRAGHWIPDQIAAAGGVDRLAVPGGRSGALSWDDALALDPEAIVVAPCGLTLEQAAAEARASLAGRPGWSGLRAVAAGRVYAADANLFTMPGASLVDGVELLAALFHPKRFPLPERLRGSFVRL
ncbi:ABC transporter substrate-binding protein [Paenibacillus sp.]|uniref:ABC transporter substrate-binding protein n=1 Tax=Paenibacillus sp. TaxID=58172 RepID=UPI002D57A161|nr:ABC transporter substrate-binding protein [Paenibacillus sp.]HZG84463.1 ABC transporter substrate-binding protein [Paenibacillus sp.]